MREAEQVRTVAIGVIIILALASLATLLFSVVPTGKSTVTLYTQGALEAAGTSVGNGSSPLMTTEAKIPVYLVGEIARPGIYEVSPGTYLYELVELAGGLTPMAAADRINLVFRIEDSRLLRIDSKDEAASLPAQIGNTTGGLESKGKTNINTASETELDTLPGIGPTTARAIISFRQGNGPFREIEEIMNVPGIKQSRFDAIKDSITVSVK